MTQTDYPENVGRYIRACPSSSFNPCAAADRRPESLAALARAAMCVAPLLLGGTAPGNYTLIGVGTVSCGKWTASRSGEDYSAKIAEEQWALGFLSGVGFEGSGKYDPLNGVDAEGVLAWLDNYCRANPLKSVATAAAAFSSAHPK